MDTDTHEDTPVDVTENSPMSASFINYNEVFQNLLIKCGDIFKVSEQFDDKTLTYKLICEDSIYVLPISVINQSIFLKNMLSKNYHLLRLLLPRKLSH